jgi:hypothetical protein
MERRNGWSGRVGGRGEERWHGTQGKQVTPRLSRLRADLSVSSLFGTIFVLIDLRHMRHCIIDASPFSQAHVTSNQILTHLDLATFITALRYTVHRSGIIPPLLPGCYHTMTIA